MENIGKTSPTVKAKRDEPGLSTQMEGLCRDRLKAVENMDIEIAKNLNKEIYKQRKREQNIKKLESVKTDLDVRDKWLGIR